EPDGLCRIAEVTDCVTSVTNKLFLRPRYVTPAISGHAAAENNMKLSIKTAKRFIFIRKRYQGRRRPAMGLCEF
ncbi:hypothetical protein, partial [Methylobacter sp.]|uniref:hypothetical protein n=1 Tax=Methylobacter sp. TaxID=2051955 RepID=UPI002FDCD064